MSRSGAALRFTPCLVFWICMFSTGCIIVPKNVLFRSFMKWAMITMLPWRKKGRVRRKNGKNLDISIRGFVRSLFGVSLSSHDFLCCKYGSWTLFDKRILCGDPDTQKCLRFLAALFHYWQTKLKNCSGYRRKLNLCVLSSPLLLWLCPSVRSSEWLSGKKGGKRLCGTCVRLRVWPRLQKVS